MKNVSLTRWAGGLALGITILLLPSGCSNKPGTIPLTGTVMFNSQPVPFGQVVFYNGEIPVATATIGPNGVYNTTLDNLPEGDLKVAIATVDLIPPDRIGLPPGKTLQSRLRHPSMDSQTGPPPPLPKTPPKPVVPQPSDSEKTGPITVKDKTSTPLTPGQLQIDMPPLTGDQKAMLQAVQKKYGNPAKSGLTYNKATGSTFNVELKPD